MGVVRDETFEIPVPDRTYWPPGRWNDEPDRVEWITQAGLPGLIFRHPSGWLCGYVAVPPGHPLHGVSFMDERMGGLRAHGDINYSAPCFGPICHTPSPGESDNVWWFGFDCGHAFDWHPPGHGREAASRAKTPFEREGGFDRYYRDIPYVKDQVERLACQLIERAL